MVPERFKASVFSLVVFATLAAFLAWSDIDKDIESNRAAGLIPLQRALSWFIVEPLGKEVAVGIVMIIGLLVAIYFWPRRGT